MGSPARQHRQHLGLAIAVAVCVLASAVVSGSAATASARPIQVTAAGPEFVLARLAYSDGFMAAAVASAAGQWPGPSMRRRPSTT